jgi:hypothetical protein
MKHKYTIARDTEKNCLVLKEYGELDKEMMSFLCEASYNDDAVKAAIAAGKESLVSFIRTENIYPPNLYADKIADCVVMIYDSDNDSETTEITFNDLDWLTKDQEKFVREDAIEDVEEIEEESDDDINELLDDDFEEDFGDDDDLNLDSPLKIADDETGDFDEET